MLSLLSSGNFMVVVIMLSQLAKNFGASPKGVAPALPNPDEFHANSFYYISPL